MRVVIKEPGKAPEIREIGSDLDSMQAVIAHGDYSMIEHVQDGPEGMDLWANEEGKYATKRVRVDTPDGPREQAVYLEANLRIFGPPIYTATDYVMGTAFVAASDDEGETIGLTAPQVAAAITWLNSHAVSIMDAARARAFAEQFR